MASGPRPEIQFGRRLSDPKFMQRGENWGMIKVFEVKVSEILWENRERFFGVKTNRVVVREVDIIRYKEGEDCYTGG